MDSIPFSNFSTTGVSSTDTFNDWRQKTNGITEQVNTISSYVNDLHNNSGVTYVTLGTPQSITGTKVFGVGSSSAPTLKIGSSGLYFEDYKLKFTTPILSNTVIASTQLGLGSTLFTVPSTAPTSTSYLSGNSGVLSWKDETTLANSLISRITSLTPGIINQIIPVGTISAYSGVTIPNGWLECNGGSVNSTTYPELYALLGTKYGVAGTLPNLQGRGIIGTGTGNDGINSQSFIIGTSGGLYNYRLVSSEMPSHTHLYTSPIVIASGGSHTHLYTSPIDGTQSSTKGIGTPVTSPLLNTACFVTANNSITGSAGDHTHTVSGGIIGSSGGNTPFSILTPYLSLTYIIKASPDSLVNTVITAGNGIQFNSGTSFNIKDSGAYTISIKHDTTLTSVDGVLKVASIVGSEIAAGTISPDKLATVGGKTISWDGSHAKYDGHNLLTAYDVRPGNVDKLREKTFGNTSAMSWNDYAYINDSGVVTVTGPTRYSIFGACNAYGHQIMPLPLDRLASKLYISEYSMACLDTTGQLWAIGKNSFNQFNLHTSGLTLDLATWSLAFPDAYSGNKTIISVVLTTYNTYVIDSDNNLWCAGCNTNGQLGKGNNIHTNDVPSTGYEVISLTNVSQIVTSGSDYTVTACIKDSSNQIKTCGYGGFGQSGGTTVSNKLSWTAIYKPLDVSDWSGYTLYNKGSLTHGGFIIVNSAGTLAYAWGYNGDGDFGIGPSESIITIPTKIWPVGSGVGTISKVYTTHSAGVIYILTSDGGAKKIFVAGSNTSGNFGNNTLVSNNTWSDVTPVITDHTLEDLYVSNGTSNACSVIIKCNNSVLDKKFLFGAGMNLSGQLGNAKIDAAIKTYTPVLIQYDVVADIKDVQINHNSLGKSYSLITRADSGELYWAGFNSYNFDAGMESSIINNQYRTIFNRVK